MKPTVKLSKSKPIKAHDVILEIKMFELNRFSTRWLERANTYKGKDDLADYFDRFFTLYVIFNRIYNLIVVSQYENKEIRQMIVDKKLHAKNLVGDFSVSDNKAATVCVTQFLFKELDEVIKENETSINGFIEMIKNSEFNLVLRNGFAQISEDKKLKSELESKDKFKKVNALLKILYNIRCNIFHGEKGYNEDQKKLLAPANECLQNVIDLLLKKVPDIKTSVKIKPKAVN